MKKKILSSHSLPNWDWRCLLFINEIQSLAISKLYF